MGLTAESSRDVYTIQVWIGSEKVEQQLVSLPEGLELSIRSRAGTREYRRNAIHLPGAHPNPAQEARVKREEAVL